MKAGLLGAAVWTPERGGLSAEDGLGQLSRFSRCCAALVERLCVPKEGTAVVIGTCTGTEEPPSAIADELHARWPGARTSMVTAGVDTVPLSFLDAVLTLRSGADVVWVVAELQPGAELVGAFALGRAGDGAVLCVERHHGPSSPSAAHLNPCTPILQLEALQPVSLALGSWLLTLSIQA